jgi:hypothetical protein
MYAARMATPAGMTARREVGHGFGAKKPVPVWKRLESEALLW